MASAQPGDFTLSYSALIADRAQDEARPKMVASEHINKYRSTGPSGALQLSRYDDIGRADTVAAGTEYVTEAAVGSTSTTITPTRRMKMALVDIETARQRVPETSLESLVSFLQQGGGGLPTTRVNELAMAAEGATGQEASQLVRSHLETVEYDTVQLYSGFSNQVGSTGVNCTVDNFEEGLYTLENGESLPHRNLYADLDLRQIYDIRADIRANETSTPFTSDVASILALRPDLARNGLQGALLGVPVYAHDSDVRLTANAGADVVGLIALHGEGEPEVSGGTPGIPGALAMVQRHAPILTISWIPRANSFEIVLMWPWAVGERIDTWGVGVVTDA